MEDGEYRAPPLLRSGVPVRTGRISAVPDASLPSSRPTAVSRALAVSLVAVMVALLSLLTALFAAFAPGIATVGERQLERDGRLAEDEASLLDHMVLMQRYIEKAALASEAGNWPLTAFYSDKISERATRVIDGGYIVDGVDMSEIAADVADPRATALATAARTGDAEQFEAAYDQMVIGCNTCHARAGYPVIRIQRPDGASYPSQVFDAPNAPLSSLPRSR